MNIERFQLGSKIFTPHYLSALAKLYVSGLKEENDSLEQSAWRKFQPNASEQIQAYLKEILTHPGMKESTALFIALDNHQEIIGYTLVTLKTCVGEVPEVVGCINGLYVRPEYRRQGVADALYKTSTNWFSNQKINYVELNANCGNLAACAFWAKHGFKQVEFVMGNRFNGE